MLHRRDAMIRLGQAGLGSLTLPGLLGLEQALASEKPAGRSGKALSGKAKSCILLYLWGGPPQQDMFDMKPNAPEQIRGVFNPASTRVPGIQICEELPRMARHTDKMAIVRSFTHDSDNHIPSVYYTLTGRKDRQLVNLRQRNRQDWPIAGSVVAKFTPPGPLPATVTIPRPVGHDGVVYSGTHAGFLGAKNDPFEALPPGEVKQQAPHDLGLPGGLDAIRIQSRFGLLNLLDAQDRELQRTGGPAPSVDALGNRSTFGPSAQGLVDFREQAFRMLTSPEAKQAFDLSREPDHLRELYGRNEYGESFLLARRLVESGVRLVTVVWTYIHSSGDVANVWDNHGGTGFLGGIKGYEMLRAPYCFPALDLAYSALVEDLTQRGLLDDTLLVMLGEFGRTPIINNMGGRDHWGYAQSIVLAGGGVQGGQIYGATDKHAAQVTENPVAPQDVIATMFHALGLPPDATINDHNQRPHPISDGKPLTMLF